MRITYACKHFVTYQHDHGRAECDLVTFIRSGAYPLATELPDGERLRVLDGGKS